MNSFLRYGKGIHLIMALLAVTILSCSDEDEPPVAEVIGISPSSAVPGGVVAITGKNFSPVFSENKIVFNGKDALVLNASTEQVNVVVPAGAETGPVSVSVKGKQAKNQPVFTVELLPSVISNISPLSGESNTVVTITGSNFLTNPANNIVTFNGVPGVVTSATKTSLTVQVPARAGSGPVIVNGVAAAARFNYTPIAYMAGYTIDKDGFARAVYWKNGIPTIVSRAGINAYGYDIAVVGEDVYVSGTTTVGFTTVACYWKNGVETVLSDAAAGSYAQGMVAVGQDVYIAGYELLPMSKSRAKYWKNGIGVNVTDGTSIDLSYEIAVNGPDVYLVGSSVHSNGNTVATYWKNGVRQQLTEGVSFAWNIFVNGNDVYTTGSIRNTGPGVGFVSYWKNNAAFLLGPGLAGGYGRDIVVKDNVVYVAGGEDNAKFIQVAKYWKNSIPVVLTDGSQIAVANAIDVIGDDVYAAGRESLPGGVSVAKYWKNGVPFNVSDGGSVASIQAMVLR